MKKNLFFLLLALTGISACARLPDVSPPIIAMTAPAPPLSASTNTSLPAVAATATLDASVFGSLNAGEIQAQAIETVANDIFKKTMDGLVAAGSISDYQITAINVLPGDENLIAEITYNVKTNDSSWLSDGGMQTSDGWIDGNCSRFDLAITETEFQLTHRRLCS